MCRLHTEGTLHGHCGHYVITKKGGQEDCGNRFCMHSGLHQDNCPHCPNCRRYLDPDASETVTLYSPDPCPQCQYWFYGPGARHR